MVDESRKVETRPTRYKSHRKEIEKTSVETLTVEQWEYCKSYFNFSCAYCRKKVKVLCRDHLIPLNLGGTLSVDNVVPCCERCNSSKSNRKFSLWYRETSFYSYKMELKILEYLELMKQNNLPL